MRCRNIVLVLGIYLVIIAVSCSMNKNESPELLELENEIVSPELTHSHITSFAEDKWGHIWVGTSHGLNKSTVSGYHQYLASKDSLTIDDNHISSLLCDSQKRLWVATINNKVSVLGDDGNFRRVAVDYNKIGKTQLTETTDGKIVLNAENRLFVYDEERNLMKQVLDSPEKNIGCFDIGNDKMLVIYQDVAIVYSCKDFAKVDSINLSGKFRMASKKGDDEIWLSTRGLLAIYDIHSEKMKAVPAPLANYLAQKQLTVSQVLDVTPNTIMLNTREAGIICYDPHTHAFTTQNDNGSPYNIGKYHTSCLFMDSNHNLWIGSDGGGYKIVGSSRGFFNSLADNGFFDGMQITSLATDMQEKALWVVAFDHELSRFDIRTQQVIQFSDFSREAGEDIRDIAICNGNELWILTGKSVVKMQFVNGRLVKDRALPVDGAEQFLFDRNECLWVYLRSGDVIKLQPKSASFETVFSRKASNRSKSLMTLRQNGNILLGGVDADLIEINTDNFRYEVLISATTLMDICTDGHFVPEVIKEIEGGGIWIGTQSDGVIKVDSNGKHASFLKGIRCEEISSLEQDQEGNVWIGTQYGLYECDSQGRLINRFFRHDGLSGNAFNERVSAMLPDGTLVFGGTQGITAFRPSKKQEKKHFEIVFEDLKVNNKLIVPGKDKPIQKMLSDNPTIKLKYDQNNFSISYTVLDYINSSRVHYYYKLDGVDKYWIDAGANTEAFYSSIPAGHYTFRVRIEDHSKKGDYFTNAIEVIVNPAPWATWWAYLIYLVIVGSVIRHYYYMYRRSAKERERVRKAEEERQQEQRTNEINKRYFSNVAHQLRTPITMISAPIRQLVEDTNIKGNNRQLLMIVNHSVGRILRMINQLMDFNKLETDALSLHVDLADVTPILKRTLEIFRINAEEKEITIVTEGLDNNRFSYVDDDKLVNIVDNLLSNAIKFTPTGGEIELKADSITKEEAARRFILDNYDSDSKYLSISVSDSGPGIPNDQLDKIFERYYQVDTHQRGNYNWGTGIGLYYAKRLTELHHGHISAENDDKGGACFRFILPMSKESYTEAERLKEEKGSEVKPLTQEQTIKLEDEVRPIDVTDMNKPQVLIVDDDTDISYFLRTLLSPYYRVTCCYDAESAMEQLQEQMPDIVISDVVMTGESGVELCKYVKTELQFCHIPVILLTAKSNIEDQIQGISAGADAYVSKPFSSAYLLQLVDTTLANRERLKKVLTDSTLANTVSTNGLSSQDKAFLDELYGIMNKELANSEFNVSDIVEEMHLSHSKFIYKVKGLTGQTPAEFFKNYKLNRAADLIKEGKYNVSEVADLTGFSTLAHFSKVFKKKFGVSPSEYNG